MKVKSLSRVRLLATPWTAAYQAPLSMGFSRQEYWSGVPLPSPILTIAASIYSYHVSQQTTSSLKETVLIIRKFPWYPAYCLEQGSNHRISNNFYPYPFMAAPKFWWINILSIHYSCVFQRKYLPFINNNGPQNFYNKQLNFFHVNFIASFMFHNV